MLNRVLRITIVVVFAVTGLILTEYLLPYISDYFDYKFYGNGFFGIAFTTIVSGSVGIFVFGSMGMALAPVIIRKMTSWENCHFAGTCSYQRHHGNNLRHCHWPCAGQPFGRSFFASAYYRALYPAYFQRSAFHGRRQGSFAQASGYCRLF